MQGGFKFRIRAAQLDRINLNDMIRMDAIGKLAFRMMRGRVQRRQRSETGQPLPAYHVKEYKVRERSPSKPSQTRRVGEGWDEARQGPPPDIYQQIRQLGGVIHKGTHWKGGEPIRYSDKSPVREKRGQIWGYRWSTPRAYLRHNYGGTDVDHTVSGRMWDSPNIKARAPRSGNMNVTVGFRGAAPRGGVYTVLKKIKHDRKQRLAAGKRPRRVPASIKAYLANARTRSGKISHKGAIQWLGMSDEEMQKALEAMNRDVLGDLDKLPIKVIHR